VLGIWKHTLSELNEVLNIIVYANKENDDFLGDYPTAWLQLVHNRNGEISSLKKGIHALNDKIYKLQTILNTREKELEEVKSRYANHEDELEVSQSHLQNLEEKLLQLLDVKIIVENNLAQLRKFPDMEKAAQKLNKSQQALNTTTTTTTKSPFHAYNFY
jgi:chromosome segregation ATPase